ncbi:molybdate ABC transporter permease subunit [Rubrivirga marina]|uniref:ABC transmembrane type-1 domain-containing protein n=1 Tax=Rubrivirga marina TaxID=1196024 RepID=A0A271J190_9BACT|nr:ABC transporter permease subunit [Rubrivirga marina]PAP77291.1 hypothetical protein BSZ37_13025 [Rubrivirga marina]
MTPADWDAVVISVRVAVGATVLAAGPSLALGWWLAHRRGPWASVVEFVVLLPLVLPPVVTGYALLLVLPRGVAFTWGAGVIAAAIVGLPLFVQLARAGFEAIDRDLLDAARVDGAGRWAVARAVVAPLAAPAVAAGAALHFARALGEFGATLVVAGNLPGRTQTVPLALFSRLNQIGGEAASIRLAVVAIVLAAVSLGLSRVLLRRWTIGAAP